VVTILSNQGKVSDHGGRVRSAAQQYKIPVSKWLDLSTGANPDSWPVPDLPDSCWHCLPEPNDGLVRVASVYYGCDSLLPVAGVQAAIQALPQLCSLRRVGIVWPGYSEHANAWKMTGDAVKLIPPHEVDDSLGSIDVLVIVNPNNPTGYYFEPQTLMLWHRYLVARGGWLVVDEGFIDATPHLSLARYCPRPGLIVLRSLSKFFGLAGLRMGFVLAEKELLQLMTAYLGPWSVSNPARWIAEHALADFSWHSEASSQLENETIRLETLLTKYNLAPAGGTHMFQWVKTPNATVIHGALARRGILVRLFNAPLSLRFGIPRDDQQWKRLESALKDIIVNQGMEMHQDV